MSEHEMRSITVNGKRYDSFPDRAAREGMLPKPEEPAAVGQYLMVGDVDDAGMVTRIGLAAGATAAGTGLTAAEKNLMMTLFKATPYLSDVSAAVRTLESFWVSGSGDGPEVPDAVYYSIRYDLSGVTADRSETSIIAGGSLTMNLIPDTNAILGEVVVTMGGVDVTASAYSNGKISISSVTGDVVITASAVVANYTQIEYLEATSENGVGFLTGYSPAATDLVECEFTPMKTSVWLFPFCWSNNNAMCTFSTRVDGTAGRTSFTRRGKGGYSGRNAADSNFALPKVTGVRYRLVESPLGTATLYNKAGEELVALTDAQVSDCGNSSSCVGLFAFFDGNTIRGNTSANGLRIHFLKITDAYGTVKLDVIPVLDGEGIACMYDRISGGYLYDVSGSNTFIAGGVV